MLRLLYLSNSSVGGTFQPGLIIKTIAVLTSYLFSIDQNFA
ncbi:hypothetical protein [Nostoc sp.]